MNNYSGQRSQGFSFVQVAIVYWKQSCDGSIFYVHPSLWVYSLLSSAGRFYAFLWVELVLIVIQSVMTILINARWK